MTLSKPDDIERPAGSRVGIHGSSFGAPGEDGEYRWWIVFISLSDFLPFPSHSSICDYSLSTTRACRPNFFIVTPKLPSPSTTIITGESGQTSRGLLLSAFSSSIVTSKDSIHTMPERSPEFARVLVACHARNTLLSRGFSALAAATPLPLTGFLGLLAAMLVAL